MITATPEYQSVRREPSWREKLQLLHIPAKTKAELEAYIQETCSIRRRLIGSADHEELASAVVREYGENAPTLAFQMLYIHMLTVGTPKPEDRLFSSEVTRRTASFLPYFLQAALE